MVDVQIRAFRAEKVPFPRGFESFRFPRDEKRIAIEIGAGAGWHAIQYAKEHPETLLFAIEQTHDRFEKLASRAKRHAELSRLVPVHANAIGWVTHLVPRASIDEYLLLYPNPNPKESQRNKRWHWHPFFAKLIETLKPNGTLTLATNERFYADEAKEVISKQWGMRLDRFEEVSLRTHSAYSPRTHFEKKYLERGETVFDLKFSLPPRLHERA